MLRGTLLEIPGTTLRNSETTSIKSWKELFVGANFWKTGEKLRQISRVNISLITAGKILREKNVLDTSKESKEGIDIKIQGRNLKRNSRKKNRINTKINEKKNNHGQILIERNLQKSFGILDRFSLKFENKSPKKFLIIERVLEKYSSE